MTATSAVITSQVRNYDTVLEPYTASTPLMSRVAPMHCCTGAPSDPYVPLVAAYGSSKP